MELQRALDEARTRKRDVKTYINFVWQRPIGLPDFRRNNRK